MLFSLLTKFPPLSLVGADGLSSGAGVESVGTTAGIALGVGPSSGPVTIIDGRSFDPIITGISPELNEGMSSDVMGTGALIGACVGAVDGAGVTTDGDGVGPSISDGACVGTSPLGTGVSSIDGAGVPSLGAGVSAIDGAGVPPSGAGVSSFGAGVSDEANGADAGAIAGEPGIRKSICGTAVVGGVPGFRKFAGAWTGAFTGFSGVPGPYPVFGRRFE